MWCEVHTRFVWYGAIVDGRFHRSTLVWDESLFQLSGWPGCVATVFIVVPSAGTSAYGFCCARGKVIKQVRDSPLEAISNGDTGSVNNGLFGCDNDVKAAPGSTLDGGAGRCCKRRWDGDGDSARSGFRRCNLLDLVSLRWDYNIQCTDRVVRRHNYNVVAYRV